MSVRCYIRIFLVLKRSELNIYYNRLLGKKGGTKSYARERAL